MSFRMAVAVCELLREGLCKEGFFDYFCDKFLKSKILEGTDKSPLCL